MKIHQYINPHRLSNSYVLELADGKVVLIDVGDFDTKPFLEWLQQEGKALTHVILTHEHADHCCGVDTLAAMHSFQLICTSKCEENIRNCRQNFSYYLEEIDTFEVEYRDVLIVKDGEVCVIADESFTFIETPGHSPGGLCILVGDVIFTGDTILNGVKSPLTFPHSNRKDYQLSMEKLKLNLKQGMTIYPGHDCSFLFENFEKLLI